MQTRPADLPDEAVAAEVAAGWGLTGLAATYRPVGFGSHHWSLAGAPRDGQRWFASVDVLGDHDAFGALAAALEVASAARSAGLDFAVAPVRSTGGGLLRRVGDRYALAVYPHVDGEPGAFGDRLTPADADLLVAMLAALHALPPVSRPGLRVDPLTVPGRAALESAVAEAVTGSGWPGPYGGQLAGLLARHSGALRDSLREHDALLGVAGPQDDRLVLTHGEPHRGNLLRGPAGLALVDWETARLTPPERDLWLVEARTDRPVRAAYAARTGQFPDEALLARYRLAWSLTDVSLFVADLRSATVETADTVWSWAALRGTLDELSDRVGPGRRGGTSG